MESPSVTNPRYITSGERCVSSETAVSGHKTVDSLAERRIIDALMTPLHAPALTAHLMVLTLDGR